MCDYALIRYLKYFLIEILCKALSSASITAKCTYNGNWVSCDSPVLPRTRAKLSCQNSYQPESNQVLSTQRDSVTCNANGQWEPEPIRCTPGLPTINIYFNNNLLLHTTLDRNNATFIEILNDRVIIHTNVKNSKYPDIDIRIPTSSNDLATEKSWT